MTMRLPLRGREEAGKTAGDREQLRPAKQLHIWTPGLPLNHSQLPDKLFELHRYKHHEDQGRNLTPPLPCLTRSEQLLLANAQQDPPLLETLRPFL